MLHENAVGGCYYIMAYLNSSRVRQWARIITELTDIAGKINKLTKKVYYIIRNKSSLYICIYIG